MTLSIVCETCEYHHLQGEPKSDLLKLKARGWVVKGIIAGWWDTNGVRHTLLRLEREILVIT